MTTGYAACPQCKRFVPRAELHVCLDGQARYGPQPELHLVEAPRMAHRPLHVGERIDRAVNRTVVAVVLVGVMYLGAHLLVAAGVACP